MWIQVCGPIVVRRGSERLDPRFPGRQGRLAFVFLAVERGRQVRRDELADVLWPTRPPAASDAGLRALLSKLRAVLGCEVLPARDHPGLLLAADDFVDLEAARDALHRAEAAVARRDFADAWGPARVALHTSERGFLADQEGAWIEHVRADLDDLRLRALECVAAVGLGLGPCELESAERAGRRMVELAPFRESGWVWLMRAQAARGNPAEALLTYERLRGLLRESLGATPGPLAQRAHAELLGAPIR